MHKGGRGRFDHSHLAEPRSSSLPFLQTAAAFCFRRSERVLLLISHGVCLKVASLVEHAASPAADDEVRHPRTRKIIARNKLVTR